MRNVLLSVLLFAGLSMGIITLASAAPSDKATKCCGKCDDTKCAPGCKDCGCCQLKPDDDTGDLSGIYSVDGETNGQQYGGCVLVVKAAHGYVFLWSTTVATDEGIATSTVRGVGLRKGDILSVSWGDGKSHGITVFAVSGKRLNGEWTQSQALGVKNRETLMRMSGIPRGVQ